MIGLMLEHYGLIYGDILFGKLSYMTILVDWLVDDLTIYLVWSMRILISLILVLQKTLH
jgi:hypothetical protein